MKNIVLSFTILLALLTFSGCGGDNNWDGKTGLNGSGGAGSNSSVTLSVKTLYDLIQKDSEKAYKNSLTMIESVKKLDATDLNIQDAQNRFKKLVLSYKRVETYYVAGKNSDDMFDIAGFYIEQFIKQSKNYDVAGDLDAVFAGSKAIVKNDLKGITALEYTLFGDAESLSDLREKMNAKRVASALIMAKNISKQFKAIDDYYKTDKTFLSSNDDAISVTLNVLVQQAFNLREWRVGEPAGYTAKFKDDPSTSRLEYHYSLYSTQSIKEILDTQKTIFSNGLKTIADSGNATAEADAILEAIDKALDICDSYSPNIESELESSKTKELYETARTIENGYIALIAGLNFTQDIVEADGD